MKPGFIERSLREVAAGADHAAAAERLGTADGWLQAVDARVKVAGIFALVIAAAASHVLLPLAGLFVLAVALALGSRIPLARLLTWVWTPVLFFTGPIAVPAIFLTTGGMRSAALLLLRAETAATLSAILIFTTPWPKVLRSLRTFWVPAVFVVILGMTYRYIFVILQSAVEMLDSRRSRTVGTVSPKENRRMAAASVGVLLSRSLQLSSDVHLAMLARGFRGDVRLFDDFAARTSDWVWLAVFAGVATATVWMQQ